MQTLYNFLQFDDLGTQPLQLLGSLVDLPERGRKARLGLCQAKDAAEAEMARPFIQSPCPSTFFFTADSQFTDELSKTKVRSEGAAIHRYTTQRTAWIPLPSKICTSTAEGVLTGSATENRIFEGFCTNAAAQCVRDRIWIDKLIIRDTHTSSVTTLTTE